MLCANHPTFKISDSLTFVLNTQSFPDEGHTLHPLSPGEILAEMHLIPLSHKKASALETRKREKLQLQRNCNIGWGEPGSKDCLFCKEN